MFPSFCGVPRKRSKHSALRRSRTLVLHTEVNEFGNWPSITIYFRRDQPATE